MATIVVAARAAVGHRVRPPVSAGAHPFWTPCERGQLGERAAVVQPVRAKQAADVALDRPRREEQPGGDLPVGQAVARRARARRAPGWSSRAPQRRRDHRRAPPARGSRGRRPRRAGAGTGERSARSPASAKNASVSRSQPAGSPQPSRTAASAARRRAYHDHSRPTDRGAGPASTRGGRLVAAAPPAECDRVDQVEHRLTEARSDEPRPLRPRPGRAVRGRRRTGRAASPTASVRDRPTPRPAPRG